MSWCTHNSMFFQTVTMQYFAVVSTILCLHLYLLNHRLILSLAFLIFLPHYFVFFTHPQPYSSLFFTVLTVTPILKWVLDIRKWGGILLTLKKNTMKHRVKPWKLITFDLGVYCCADWILLLSYTECFMSCGYYCRRRFSGSLSSNRR